MTVFLDMTLHISQSKKWDWDNEKQDRNVSTSREMVWKGVAEISNLNDSSSIK